VDYLRPVVFRDKRIARWYTYNILLYVRDDMISSLPEAVRQCRLRDAQSLDEHWPLFYRLRDALIRQLPIGAKNRLACAKGRWWRVVCRLFNYLAINTVLPDATWEEQASIDQTFTRLGIIGRGPGCLLLDGWWRSGVGCAGRHRYV